MHAHTHAHTQTCTCMHTHTTKTQVASCNSLLACLCCCVCVTSFRVPINSLACWFCTSTLDSDISLENWQNVPVSMCFWWQTPLKNWNFKSTTAEIILYYTSAILHSQAYSLRLHAILLEWTAFYSTFLNIHHSGVLTSLTWLVPHETAAILTRSVYTLQPCTMSLHAKPQT